ncbi:uncharacterized protein MONBRDRAFT_27776 [Monosiga brevicollis MX1]|uniref:MYND-type domain-containing protein n=1 Tax=Monosiga brevicollis TaxID=81824 RepID=A9V6A2_MONBE|nr:uncharacterized protein MONBRDRAFT_27776 [Monosiga brevicollis MX1]EDQ87033.1 predicted protein [Monosiga brevicollis MX1]|eukprot:XP_001748272.1 hypothetical protein [Monosiga brevicollis MX1]
MFEVVGVPGRGRAVRATKALARGQTVLLNPPLAFVLRHEERVARRCEDCFVSEKPEHRLANCSLCHTAAYCSKPCQTRNWKRAHKHVCKLLQTLPENPQPPHIIDAAAMTVATLVALERRAKLEDKESEQASPDPGSAVRQPRCADFWAMAQHTPTLNSEELDDVLQLVAVTQCPGSTDKQRVMDVLQRADCNNFSIWDELLLPRGAGVYPWGAILNHSCEPNCVMTYRGPLHAQAVKALRDIAVGEELCHSYIDLYAPTGQRHSHLGDQYGFECDCALYLDGALAELDALPEVTAAEMRLPGKMLHELECEAEERQRLLSLYRAAETLKDYAWSTPEEELVCLLQGYNILRRLAHPANISLTSIMTRLQNVATECGRLEDIALPVGQHLALAYDHVYPEHNPLCGLQYYRLGDVANLAQKQALALLWHRRAYQVLRTTHDADHWLLTQLQETYGF